MKLLKNIKTLKIETREYDNVEERDNYQIDCEFRMVKENIREFDIEGYHYLDKDTLHMIFGLKVITYEDVTYEN